MYCVDDFNIYNGKNHNISLQPFLQDFYIQNLNLLFIAIKICLVCKLIVELVGHKNKEVIMILAALNKNTLCFFYEHEKMVQHRYVAFFILMYQSICQTDKRCNYQNICVKVRLFDLQVKKNCGLLLIKAYEQIFPWLIGFTLVKVILRSRIDDHQTFISFSTINTF